MILAIDTATRSVGLALRDDHEIIAETTWRTSNHHTAELGPAIDELLKRAGVAPADLTAIAVATGPGSFTGLRIGMAAAKGLALSAGGRIPLVGVQTLDIVAAGQPHPDGIDRLCAIVQAGRGRVSAGMYGWSGAAWASPGEPFLATWEDLINRLEGLTLVGGEIDPAGREALAAAAGRAVIVNPAGCLRRAGYLAEIAAARLAEGLADNPATLAPTYLH